MRSALRKRQDVWFCETIPVHVGADTAYKYSKPEKRHFGVSATSGWANGTTAGFILDYDRFITCYDRSFKPKEGTMVFVDVIPVLDEEGNLVISDDGISPITPPDYIIKNVYDTQKGRVARFSLKKV